jgi:hypothetical protein
MLKNSSIIKKKTHNLNDLLSLINNDFADWPDYIFRGQAQSDWLLEPTLSRALKTIKYQNKENLVKSHLEKFKLEIRGRRGLNPRQLSENELWALGQHFGLYTPLLDWTKSPYVALFFALTSLEKSSTGYRTLWALNSTDIEDITKWYKENKFNKSKFIVELINPILDENSRLVNQNGLFTKINLENDIESWVSNGPNLDWVKLFKIDFPDDIRDRALAYLDLMNINYASLFPDLFGSSMNTNVKLEQSDYIIKKQNDSWDALNKKKE